MARHHARALARLERPLDVVQIYDPDEAARESVRELWPAAVGYPELDRQRLVGVVDTVHICTPPSTHVRLATIALAAGCHVYIEKPFARTEVEADSLLRRAGEGNLILCAGHQLLFEAPTRKLSQLLPALGKICHLESYFAFRPSRPERGAGLAADEQLTDILPHPLYLLLSVLEEAVPDARAEAEGISVGGEGTVHAHIRAGDLVGSLIVTLTGRPVQSYLKVVGENGTLRADYVRGIVLHAVGPGASAIDKVLQPYRTARQLVWGTSLSLARRVVRRQRSYPGLVEAFAAFYDAVEGKAEPPLTDRHLLDTARLFERVVATLAATPRPSVSDGIDEGSPGSEGGRRPPESVQPGRATGRTFEDRVPSNVVVTGGTGFLGRAVVRALAESGVSTRVFARRLPAAWERYEGVEYEPVDLGVGCPPDLLDGVAGIIHCAAETRGGWEAHRRNSIGATENLLHAAAEAGATRILLVSSLAVLASQEGEALDESVPLRSDHRQAGPYVWGKLTAERRAREIARDLELDLKVVRPGAIIDSAAFEPPGRLGRRIGNLFVAVGSPSERLGVVERSFAAHLLADLMLDFDGAPDVLNLLDPELPTRRALVERLKDRNPSLRVIWLPGPLLRALSAVAVLAQKLLRRNAEPLRLHRAFASERYDTTRVKRLIASRSVSSDQGDERPIATGGV